MRRVIAAVVALALAGVGTFFLVRFVRSAEDRALEGQELVNVRVVAVAISAGTPSEDLLDEQVPLQQVPRDVAAQGVVTDMASLAGKVAAIDLLPGEQVIASRFVTLAEYRASLGAGPRIEAPADMLQVTVSLSPERVVGGELQPGDIVAVFASFDPFPLGAIEPTGLEPDEIPVLVPDTGLGEEPSQVGVQSPNSTKILLHKVLVTNVQAEELPREVTDEEAAAGVAAGAPDLAPTGNLLITLALAPVDAERFVFTAEHGWVWLALEGSAVSEADTEVQNRNTVYEAP